jgi:hypothetical protein
MLVNDVGPAKRATMVFSKDYADTKHSFGWKYGKEVKNFGKEKAIRDFSFNCDFIGKTFSTKFRNLMKSNENLGSILRFTENPREAKYPAESKILKANFLVGNSE